MQCTYHPEDAGVGYCSACGKPICDRCTARMGGRLYCQGCAFEKAGYFALSGRKVSNSSI